MSVGVSTKDNRVFPVDRLDDGPGTLLSKTTGLTPKSVVKVHGSCRLHPWTLKVLTVHTDYIPLLSSLDL